jgi:GntR family transcriptional regulator, transcriptional repressor for pyruvate dehydrogenase complex
MLIDGELQPGQRLPVEKELAARLGVSRNSLRGAVRALTTIRVLQTRQGDGTYVTSLSPELLLDAASDHRVEVDAVRCGQVAGEPP